jgi:hypothetical protein
VRYLRGRTWDGASPRLRRERRSLSRASDRPRPSRAGGPRRRPAAAATFITKGPPIAPAAAAAVPRREARPYVRRRGSAAFSPTTPAHKARDGKQLRPYVPFTSCRLAARAWAGVVDADDKQFNPAYDVDGGPIRHQLISLIRQSQTGESRPNGPTIWSSHDTGRHNTGTGRRRWFRRLARRLTFGGGRPGGDSYLRANRGRSDARRAAPVWPWAVS